MIEHIPQEEVQRLVEDINKITNILIIDQNGYHVVLKALEVFSKDQVIYIISYIKSNMLDIALTRHGCCAIQKILEEENLPSRSQLFNKIIKLSSRLICDSQGHYVLSFVVSLKMKRYNYEIVKNLMKEADFSILCQSKHSASVIEKLIDYGCCKSKRVILSFFYSNMENLMKLLYCQMSYGVSGK